MSNSMISNSSMSDIEEFSEVDLDSTRGGNSGKEEESQHRDVKEIRKAATRTWIIALLLILGGAAASAAFLYVGISGAKNDQLQNFERRANDFSKEIDNSWDDYEGAARWTHSECRHWRTDNFTHADFEALYYYLTDAGLDFYSINWIPNITHAERPAVEEKEGAFWRTIEGAENYDGFTGQEKDPENPGELIYAKRSEQPYYFPIYFVEPKAAAASVIHYDLFSAPWEKPAISKALETYQPALTGRFVLAQHTEDEGYSTLLYHPGVELPDHLAKTRHDLVTIVMTINPFLERAARNQDEPLSVYLYDKSWATHGQEETKYDGDFLGGVQIAYNSTGDRQVVLLKEIEYAELQDSKLYYEREIHVGGRTWTTVVVADEGSYQQNVIFVWLCGIMIFGASLLLALIWVMHNRRRTEQVMKIVDKAAAESKIVSNLFPGAVRDHMITQQREADAQEQALPSKDTFMRRDGSDFNMFNQDSNATEKSSSGIYKTKPIADRYEATTIMFADLAGFTAWSSTRSPEDVFTLLETLYGAFDSIAKRRRVFKVETIGDCYVAVCGLPKPRADHAIVMCRFANDCLHKMQKLTKVLAETLGEDTLNLCFRVGLHSGPVTAGVLRGDKGRFQLFGDTMNTASRMESTGVKNKIQVSQQTSDQLIAGGYEKWLTPREEMVHAKGKGNVQTFFVNIAAGSTTSFQTSLTADTGISHSFQSDNSTGVTDEFKIRLGAVDDTTTFPADEETGGSDVFREEGDYTEVVYV